MALNDWNMDGKKDSFDDFIEFNIVQNDIDRCERERRTGQAMGSGCVGCLIYVIFILTIVGAIGALILG
ncbi:MAG: hypothetical protein K6G85_04055 [Eubacterium sp.]|nr:hypothetical protein [Eubacterium sp.]